MDGFEEFVNITKQVGSQFVTFGGGSIGGASEQFDGFFD